jgi:predicted RNase H-like nuclease (RuvC/YqgF family)
MLREKKKSLTKRPKIIVGIDPGVTCGIAILSLDGRPIFIQSFKKYTRSSLLATIATYGDPVIVAVDVPDPPYLAEAIARNFEASLFVPSILMSIFDKQKLVQEYAEKFEVKLKDQHQKDALAAAFKAFNYYKNKFKQAEAHLREVNISLPIEEVQSLLVKGFSLAESIEMLRVEKKSKKIILTKPEEIKQKNDLLRVIKILNSKIRDQNNQIIRLKAWCEIKKLEIQKLKNQLEFFDQKFKNIENEQVVAIKREKEYGKLISEIQSLRARTFELEQELRKLKPLTLEELHEMELKKEITIMKSVQAFSQEEIEKTIREVGIKPGEIVLLMDASGGGTSTAKRLIDRKIKAVVICNNMSHQALEELLNAGIPVIESKKIPLLWAGNIPYTKRRDLERAIEEFKNFLTSEKGLQIEKIIEEYREGKSFE